MKIVDLEKMCKFLLTALRRELMVSFFVVTHDNALVSTRLDPIMDPGMVSKHVHTIIGGSNFGPTVDYNRSIASE
jgi:hypothetical protein